MRGPVTEWRLIGDWFDNCSCAVACPCTFAQPPDNGYCEAVLFWHIRDGHYGDVRLDNLSLVRVGRWEGDLWAGAAKGEAGIIIDEVATPQQEDALVNIFAGRAGGWPEVWGSMFPEGRKLLGVERGAIEYEVAPDLASWGVRIPDRVKAWAKAITGPTSPKGKFPQLANAPGSETGPGPQLVTWGKSVVCSVTAFGYRWRWDVNSSKHIPFDWAGP